MDAITELVAIEAIKKLKAQYCRFSDTRDDEAFEALFTDDVEWTLTTSDSRSKARTTWVTGTTTRSTSVSRAGVG